MSRVCKQCGETIPPTPAEPNLDDYLLVSFTAVLHVTDFEYGQPSGNRLEPYDSGTFCGMACLATYAAYDRQRRNGEQP